MRIFSRPYVGYIEGGKMETFRSRELPTIHTHPQYLAVIGPFRTMRAAKWMAKHGRNNPHCRCVADAERLSREV